MAVTKNALLRFQTLDRCLKNTGRRYSVNDLLNEVNQALLEDNPKSNGIQKRQLRVDIAFMRSEAGYNAPIESIVGDGKKHYYFYSDPKFSINNSPLNSTEVQQFKHALTLLSRFEGSPGFEWISEMTVILRDSFGLKKENEKVISFERNEYYEGENYITQLFNAIINKQVLRIKYTPFGKDQQDLIFHPYYLKQYNNRWNVLGLNEENNIPTWNLALDRIDSLEETNLSYIPNEINWTEHFSEIYGISKPFDKEEETVELLFSKIQAPFIKSKPIHESQINKDVENGLLVKLKLIPNYELEQLILSFGESVEVLSPEHLRNKLAERLKKASNQYLKPEN